jgi:hypothetical protein
VFDGGSDYHLNKHDSDINKIVFLRGLDSGGRQRFGVIM